MAAISVIIPAYNNPTEQTVSLTVNQEGGARP